MTNEVYLQQCVETLAEHGYAICDDFLDCTTIKTLAQLAEMHYQNQKMQQAKIGKAQVMLNQAIRGDAIHWLNEFDATPAVQSYFAAMQALKAAVNTQLWMNLHTLEAHLAVYPVGAGYQKHLDQFAQQGGHTEQTRQLSTVLYLNRDWQADNDGELRLYLNEAESIDISPLAGRLVLFLSARFWHEVLPAKRQRISIAGWFRDRDTRLV